MKDSLIVIIVEFKGLPTRMWMAEKLVQHGVLYCSSPISFHGAVHNHTAGNQKTSLGCIL